MNFSAKIRQVGEISVVEVTGKLTSFESGALRKTLIDAVESATRRSAELGESMAAKLKRVV